MKKIFNFGKIDGYNNGRKTCAVDVSIELTEDNVFTACACVWNSSHTDTLMGGQCLDELRHKIHDKTFHKIYGFWKKYHLNDMHAGTEAQEKFLEEHNLKAGANYDRVCEELEKAGLLVDNGYRFGTAWLKREIPEADLTEIKALF